MERTTRKTAPNLYETENDLPKDARVEVIGILNQRLADTIDLQTQLKQAHWNVKGPHFIGLHELFDKIAEEMEDYVDMIAERAVQLGGIAEGTVRVAAGRSRLEEYPLVIADGRGMRCLFVIVTSLPLAHLIQAVGSIRKSLSTSQIHCANT